MLEIARRHVDRELELQPALAPRRRLTRRAGDDPVGHVVDEAALLGERDEFVGRHDAAGRMLPAGEGLDPANLSRPAIQLGLIFEQQLAIGDGMGERTRQQRRLELAQPLELVAEEREADRLLQRPGHRKAALARQPLGRLEHLGVDAAGDENPCRALGLGEVAQQLDAVGAGHLEIEQDDGRPPRPDLLFELGRAGGDEGLVARSLAHTARIVAEAAIVIDDQETVLVHDTSAARTKVQFPKVMGALQP